MPIGLARARPNWASTRGAWHDADVRVHRSFAFIDVSGFTALTESEGDERAVDVLTAFRALMRDICSRRGVRIAKWLGDGAMVVCVDTRPLLEAVLELHYVVTEVSGPVETVSIRSGIASGHVILMEGDDYIGHCVNVASRLCDLAPASEAWAAPSVMHELPSWGAVRSVTPVSLRGVEKPVPVASICMAFAGEDDARARRSPVGRLADRASDQAVPGSERPLEASAGHGISHSSLVEQLLRTDPSTILPFLTTKAGPLVAITRQFLVTPGARRRVAISTEHAEQLAEIAARLGLSFVLTRDTVFPVEDELALRASLRRVLHPLVAAMFESPLAEA